MSESGITCNTPSLTHRPFTRDMPMRAVLDKHGGSKLLSLTAGKLGSNVWLSQYVLHTGVTSLPSSIVRKTQLASAIKGAITALSNEDRSIGTPAVLHSQAESYPIRLLGGKYYCVCPSSPAQGANPCASLLRIKSCTSVAFTRDASSVLVDDTYIQLQAGSAWDLAPVLTKRISDHKYEIVATGAWDEPPPNHTRAPSLRSDVACDAEQQQALDDVIREMSTPDGTPPPIIITSDGSFRKHQETGSFAWAIKPAGPEANTDDKSEFHELIFAAGGGEHGTPLGETHTPAAPMNSSTRMEACAILDCLHFLAANGLHLAGAAGGKRVRWICDSKPAIFNTAKILAVTTRQLLTMPNRDIWLAIRSLLAEIPLSKCIQFVWVGSHADTKEHADANGKNKKTKEYHELSFDQKCNILADNIAEVMYTTDKHDRAEDVDSNHRYTLGPEMMGATFINGIHVTDSLKVAVTNHIRLDYIKAHFDAHQHLWGDVENIDWKVMLAAHKATTTGAHILRMKGMHAMFATNATKFLRGTIQAEEIHCTMCGRATESWWHLAGICTHPPLPSTLERRWSTRQQSHWKTLTPLQRSKCVTSSPWKRTGHQQTTSIMTVMKARADTWEHCPLALAACGTESSLSP